MCSVTCDERSAVMFCVVVLQNYMGFVEDETGYYSETCVASDVDGIEEVYIKVEEAVDIKEENPETVTLSPIKPKHEVRWCVCVCVRW
jgi:hypothetical protein